MSRGYRLSRTSRQRRGHPGYSAVWKGNRTCTPGGLRKADIMRRVVKGSNPVRYRYVSRARHEAAKARGLPAEFYGMQFCKQ